MPLILRNITEIEVSPSPGLRGLNDARVRIWRLNTELARTEGGISFMNVTTYKCTKSTRGRRILAVSAPANICYVLVSRAVETEAARSHNMRKRRVWKKIYPLKPICEGDLFAGSQEKSRTAVRESLIIECQLAKMRID